jgi:DNA-binding CsgD family transcriptional regulator
LRRGNKARVLASSIVHMTTSLAIAKPAHQRAPRLRDCWPELGTRPSLSAREKQVLVAWLRTDSKTAVGESLFISAATVRTHIQRIRDKYQAVGRPAATKAALTVRAIQDGIVSVDDL